MKNFLYSILGISLSALLLGCGIWIGQLLQPPISLTIPSHIQIDHTGIPSTTVDCLNWVVNHYEKPAAAIFSLVCHGGTL
jgi:hypothetical protein